MVESTAKWGAQVVYGDTDSLFILLPGRSRKDAFVIGAEIADAVTAANPPPVKLKFEKVLQPSLLQVILHSLVLIFSRKVKIYDVKICSMFRLKRGTAVTCTNLLDKKNLNIWPRVSKLSAETVVQPWLK